jgi:hypothetical protein
MSESTMPTWITTFTGRQFFPMAPISADIVIEDIAHQLSCMNRWAGATVEPYSIAQHSVHVSQLVPMGDALWALLHDASEAYLVDIPTHIKRLPTMAPYRAAEAQLQRLIYHRFGLIGDEPDSVKVADHACAVAEAQDLLKQVPTWWPPSIRHRKAPRTPFRIVAWPARQAERAFIEQFTAFCPPALCGTCGKNPRRPNQRTCKECHAASMKDYRAQGATR